jgi:hypothetical protein
VSAKKDLAAQSLVKKRWDKTTAEERSEIAAELGKASAKSLTKKERTERARKAGKANAGRPRKQKP